MQWLMGKLCCVEQLLADMKVLLHVQKAGAACYVTIMVFAQ